MKKETDTFDATKAKQISVAASKKMAEKTKKDREKRLPPVAQEVITQHILPNIKNKAATGSNSVEFPIFDSHGAYYCVARDRDFSDNIREEDDDYFALAKLCVAILQKRGFKAKSRKEFYTSVCDWDGSETKQWKLILKVEW